ncbi:hypothetical protein NKG05_09520 [Oerskovia sp. M15]
MSVFSDVWLDPEAALAVVSAVHPRVVLATEGRSYEGRRRASASCRCTPARRWNPSCGVRSTPRPTTSTSRH